MINAFVKKFEKIDKRQKIISLIKQIKKKLKEIKKSEQAKLVPILFSIHFYLLSGNDNLENSEERRDNR